MSKKIPLDRYLFMPKVSLQPNKVTIYNEVLEIDYANEKLKPLSKNRTIKYDPITNEKIEFKKQYHNFVISNAAQKKIKEKINWLYLLSKARYTKTYSGVEIHNFKINFLTLTLPSSQKHPTSQITSECLNQFLTEMKQRTKMENYVWRLEFQENGNVHYHIVTDTYIDYFFARDVWNRIINKLGYVNEYQEKFSKMTLNEYWINSQKYDSCTFDKCAKRYAKGKSENWTKPPSVDVKVCTSNKAIANYISKYFGKQEANKTIKNSLDNEENSFSLRLWFCSRSLSKLTSIVDYKEKIEINWFDVIKGCNKVKEFVSDYATCLFFEIRNMSNYVKSLLYPVFRNYANEMGYCSA